MIVAITHFISTNLLDENLSAKVETPETDAAGNDRNHCPNGGIHWGDICPEEQASCCDTKDFPIDEPDSCEARMHD